MDKRASPGRKDHRRQDANRVPASIACEARQGSRPWAPVRLTDISATGFRIESFAQCRSELPLRIRIPGLQMLTAKVCWMNGATIGCAFDRPLHVAVLEHIVRQARSPYR